MSSHIKETASDSNQPKRASFLDYLNFIGSICSISALLMVVFNDMNWLKGLNIITSLIFTFCCLGALGPMVVTRIKKKVKNKFALICIYMLMAILIVFASSLLFYGFYNLMEMLEINIDAILKDL